MFAQTKNSILVTVTTISVVALLSTCNAFKLPSEVNIKENKDPWMDMKSYGVVNDNDNVQKVQTNSIQDRARGRMSYPEHGGQAPSDIRYQRDEVKDDLVNYESDSLRRLERFYKQSQRIQGQGHTSGIRSAERIIFPGEETSKSIENSEEGLKLESRFKERTTEASLLHAADDPNPNSNDLSNKSKAQRNDHSLESLAQIVRHLLFRMPVKEVPHSSSSSLGFVEESATVSATTMKNNYENGEKEEVGVASNPESNMDQHGSSSSSGELDVSEQSLYSGPKLRSSSNRDCPEGYKKTRNGSCQKPSRRLMSS